MGVSFYNCNGCEEIFNDCMACFFCECGAHFCSNECGKKEVVESKDTCVICRHETCTTEELLKFALGKLGVSRKLLEEELCSSFKKTDSLG